MTSEILKIEKIKIDLQDFSQEYELNYECPKCTTIVGFNEKDIVKCDDCDEYICDDCKITKYISCGRFDCRYCRNKSSWNSCLNNYCLSCAENIHIDISEDSYESDNSEKSDIIIVKKSSSSPVEFANDKTEECNICYVNKKKYACIPCGHLCMCGQCANKINEKCPLCNIKTNSIIKIYV